MGNDRRTFLKRSGTAIGASALAVGAATWATASTSETESSVVDDVVPAHSANMSPDNRGPSDVDWIVVHVSTVPYRSTIRHITQGPHPRQVSYHYIVSNYPHTAGEPGHVTRMVDPTDRAHHGMTATNSNSIGVCHEWRRQSGERFITDECYQSSAQLIADLADRFDVPRRYYDSHRCTPNSGGGIIGHLHTPQDWGCSSWHSEQRDCPGPDWSWSTFVDFLEGAGDSDPTFEEGNQVVSANEVNVRASAEFTNNVVHTQSAGTRGTVANGPHRNEGYTWWWVEWENDVGGWSVESLIEPDDSGGGGSTDGFEEGTTVETTMAVNGREEPAWDAEVVGVLSAGTRAEIVNGPEYPGDDPWWGLHVQDENLWVWVAEDYLELA